MKTKRQFRTIYGAVKKRFRLFKNTFRTNIAPENSPAKLWGPKEFLGFLINEHQLIHGSSAVRLTYLRLRVVSNFGDGDCGAGGIHTHARARNFEATRCEGSAEN